jgi:putative DNA primase/helicase
VWPPNLHWIASAGELARIILDLPWPENAANNAVATCFNAWLENRGGSEAHEIVSGIAQVRRFIEQHGESRFSVVSGEENQSSEYNTVFNRAGWRRRGDSDDIMGIPCNARRMERRIVCWI